MQKSLLAISTISALLIANTASAEITWPAEQTYEESLGAETWSTSGGCKSGQQISMRRVFFMNKDGSKNYVNKGNGVFVKGSESYGDGFEILSECYESKNTAIEEAKISKVESEAIFQKCENPFDTGRISKSRQFTAWSSDRVSSNFRTSFLVTISNTCGLNETKVFDNPVCATKNPTYPLGTIYGTWSRTTKDGVMGEWTLNPFYTNTNKCYKTVTETKNPTCPTGYSGQMTQSRTYDLWKTGSTKNDTGFITTQDTCLKNESHNDECTIDTSSIQNGAYTLKGSNNTGFYWGKYGIHAVMVPVPGTSFTQNGYTYYVGAHSGADVYGICRKPDLAFSHYYYDNSKSLCPTDKPLGVINIQQKYEVWTDGSIRNKSEWYETSNTCEAIKAQTVEVKPGSETVSCDSYYGVQPGTYTGIVTKTGDNITIFDPASGTTNTTFQTKSEDTTSCVKEITATTKEIIEENCPAGFSGKITSYLIKAEGANGSVYPYGTTPILESNTCIAASTDAEKTIEAAKQQDTVLSNLSFTTTSISKSDLIINELNKINTSSLESKGYIMNINADDLSANAFDKNKITNLVKTFKTKLGSQSSNVKLASVPNSLEKFIGQNGLTLDRIKNEKLTMTGSTIDGGTVTVKYLSLTNTKPVQSSFTVKVFD